MKKRRLQEPSMRSALGQPLKQSYTERNTSSSSAMNRTIEQVPPSKAMRERLRSLSADLVASWSCEGVPAEVKSRDGLRKNAADLVERAQADVSFTGWTMVTILSEVWRYRIASTAAGQRLLLLPDCPSAAKSLVTEDSCPAICGPSCGIGTVWSAAHDSGWVVESSRGAVAAIGSLLTGQYQGILGVAELRDLEKAFGMLPAFAFPVAAVPFQQKEHPAGGTLTCNQGLLDAGIDVEWVLSLLGFAGGTPGPVGDYLPLLREASELFSGDSIKELADKYHLGDGFGSGLNCDEGCKSATSKSVNVTARLAGEFLGRGGKFLRPFVTLAAFDAVCGDLHEKEGEHASMPISRDTARTAAVAIEIFHKASLVHDDIEDGDTARYGKPTVHLDHGIPAAINIGDYLVGAGYRLIAGLDSSPSVRSDLLTILADAHVRLSRGQGAELWWRDVDDDVTHLECLEIYGLKTSPAFEAAVAMGIRLAGLQPADALSVSRYALHVGTGFQVLNDLKDWQGDLENDRREAGDILGGRPTVMWALALENLNETGRLELLQLRELCSVKELSAREASSSIQTARRLYIQAGVFEKAAGIVLGERQAATEAIRDCHYSRLREVLEFLLDLAVPQQAIDDLLTSKSAV